MKIDADLRCAIKSAERAQPVSDWQAREKANQEAVAALLAKRPAIARSVKKANGLYKRGDKLKSQATTLIQPFGVSLCATRICDEEKFLQAGGKVPPPPHKKWSADKVIAELAAASPKEAKAILKRYNIRWD